MTVYMVLNNIIPMTNYTYFLREEALTKAKKMQDNKKIVDAWKPFTVIPIKIK